MDEQFPQRRDQGDEAGLQHGADADIDDTVCATGVEPDGDSVVPAAPPGGETRAAPAGGGDAHQGRHRHLAKPVAGQRLDDGFALPRGVEAVLQMLERAAAAGPEMGADRLRAAFSLAQHFGHRAGEFTAARGCERCQHQISRRRVGKVRAAPVGKGRDAVTAAAEAFHRRLGDKRRARACALHAHPARPAAIRNSLLPSLPVIGLGQMP
ncbi:MAG: hypothetical protein IIB65_06135 [Proteobacteria bacterium]|nr:hypothetical protein [Pseudomonadota bacterium]